MPFAQITPHANPKIKHLEERLVQEWTYPQENNAEPVIIEESDRQQTTENLYVIWEEWAEISQYVRTKIILNAYEQVRGKKLSLNIIDAMGFTAEEADRAGIEYSPLEAAA